MWDTFQGRHGDEPRASGASRHLQLQTDGQTDRRVTVTEGPGAGGRCPAASGRGTAWMGGGLGTRSFSRTREHHVLSRTFRSHVEEAEGHRRWRSRCPGTIRVRWDALWGHRASDRGFLASGISFLAFVESRHLRTCWREETQAESRMTVSAQVENGLPHAPGCPKEELSQVGTLGSRSSACFSSRGICHLRAQGTLTGLPPGAQQKTRSWRPLPSGWREA